MVLVLRERDFSSKHKCQALENFRHKINDIRHARRSKARLLGFYLTLLQEKLVVAILL